MRSIFRGLQEKGRNLVHNKSSLRGDILWVLMAILFVISQSRNLISQMYSNLSATAMPPVYVSRLVQNRGSDTLHDPFRSFRLRAVSLNKNNHPALLQLFRWHRAIGDLPAAAQLLPELGMYEFIEIMPDYSLIKAEYLRQKVNWQESKIYYQAALTGSEILLAGFRRTDYYDTLARSELTSDSYNIGLAHFRASKYFMQAGNSREAADQARWLLTQESSQPTYMSWANYLLAVSNTGQTTEEKLALLEKSVSIADNPSAAVELYNTARENGDQYFINRSTYYLSKLKPNFLLTLADVPCEDTWHLAGYDVDEEILNAGIEALLNLYWFPLCGDLPDQYGLVQAGSLWLQTGYIADNVFIDPGFEWVLPEHRETYSGSSSDCCKKVVSADQNGSALQIATYLPNTRAAQPATRHHVEGDASFLVSGSILWQKVEATGQTAAVIGGFWQNQNEVRVPGFNNAIDNLQEFIINFPEQSENLSKKQVLRTIVHSPSDAAYFLPWIGLTSSFSGFAIVHFDNLVMAEINPPVR